MTRPPQDHVGYPYDFCTCGHSCTVHSDIVGGFALGHGACWQCSCEKFHWSHGTPVTQEGGTPC